MKRFLYYFKAMLVVFLALSISGCGIFKNAADSVAGRYINGLEQAKENSQSQVFDCEIGVCFDKIIHILDEMGAEILKMDIYKYSILALVSIRGMEEKSGDTLFDPNNADVGIFLTEEAPDKTRVRISCFSLVFLDHTSQKIFPRLQNK